METPEAHKGKKVLEKKNPKAHIVGEIKEKRILRRSFEDDEEFRAFWTYIV